MIGLQSTLLIGCWLLIALVGSLFRCHFLEGRVTPSLVTTNIRNKNYGPFCNFYMRRNHSLAVSISKQKPQAKVSSPSTITLCFFVFIILRVAYTVNRQLLIQVKLAQAVVLFVLKKKMVCIIWWEKPTNVLYYGTGHSISNFLSLPAQNKSTSKKYLVSSLQTEFLENYWFVCFYYSC